MWRRGLQLPCYEGDKPFVYACFAGVDKRRVYPYLRQLQDRRFRISFFDDASPDGAEAQRIAARIAKAQLVLLFFSERANHVPIWRYQVNYATELEKKICCVRLDDSAPQKGMLLQSGGIENFDAYRYRNDGAFYPAFVKMADVTQDLIGDGVEGYPAGLQKNGLLQCTWFYVACAFLLAAAVLAVILPPRIRAMQAARRGEPVAITYLSLISFTEPVIQRAVESALFKSEGETVFEEDLAGIKKLGIYGNAYASDTDTVKYAVANGVQRAYINGDTVETGRIADIRELTMLQNLENLTISCEQIEDFSMLDRLQKLTYLDISGNPATDISAIGNLPVLETLDLSCTAVEDFSLLRNMTSLRDLRIRSKPEALTEAAALPLTALTVSDASVNAYVDVIAQMESLESLDISNTDIASLAPFSDMVNLRTLHVDGCTALTDYSHLLAMPSLACIYVDGAQLNSIPEEVFRQLLDHGVAILL